MGNDTSSPLAQVPPTFSTMCISLQNFDGIAVLHHDNQSLLAIRQAIISSWPPGIQTEMSICGTGWLFNVRGKPFFKTSSFANAFNARQMIAAILQNLYKLGWRVVVSCDLARFNDKSSIFLKKSRGSFHSEARPFVCVGLSNKDKLQIVNLPSELIVPIKQTVHQFWAKGVQSESYENGVLEIKMFGNPWWETDAQSVMAKVLLQNIIATLRRYQYAYTVNVNLKTTADSLYFHYDPGLPPGKATQFCSISLIRADRLRVMRAPDAIVNLIRGVIKRVWSHGRIQDESNYHGSWEFKISGTPWRSCHEESVMARYLILKILEAMCDHGWHSIAAIDITRRPVEKSVLFFQYREPKRCQVMCLCLNDLDKIRLINMPFQVVNLLKQILLSRWPKGIQGETVMHLSFGNVLQLNLKGSPWSGRFSEDSCHIRSFLCNIIEAFASLGWRVLIAGDVSARYLHKDRGPDYPLDVHSFWFIHEPTRAQNACASSRCLDLSSSSSYGTSIPRSPNPMPRSGIHARDSEAKSSTSTHSTIGYVTGNEMHDRPPTYSEATGWSGQTD